MTLLNQYGQPDTRHRRRRALQRSGTPFHAHGHRAIRCKALALTRALARTSLTFALEREFAETAVPDVVGRAPQDGAPGR